MAISISPAGPRGKQFLDRRDAPAQGGAFRGRQPTEIAGEQEEVVEAERGGAGSVPRRRTPHGRCAHSGGPGDPDGKIHRGAAQLGSNIGPAARGQGLGAAEDREGELVRPAPGSELVEGAQSNFDGTPTRSNRVSK